CEGEDDQNESAKLQMEHFGLGMPRLCGDINRALEPPSTNSYCESEQMDTNISRLRTDIEAR
ncbi:unnamed protein product, partial [Dovyalis caffra]